MMECKEATSLESYFLFLANFSHDRAREVILLLRYQISVAPTTKVDKRKQLYKRWELGLLLKTHVSGGGNWNQPTSCHLGPPGNGWKAVPWPHLSPGAAGVHDCDFWNSMQNVHSLLLSTIQFPSPFSAKNQCVSSQEGACFTSCLSGRAAQLKPLRQYHMVMNWWKTHSSDSSDPQKSKKSCKLYHSVQQHLIQPIKPNHNAECCNRADSCWWWSSLGCWGCSPCKPAQSSHRGKPCLFACFVLF